MQVGGEGIADESPHARADPVAALQPRPHADVPGGRPAAAAAACFHPFGDRRRQLRIAAECDGTAGIEGEVGRACCAPAGPASSPRSIPEGSPSWLIWYGGILVRAASSLARNSSSTPSSLLACNAVREQLADDGHIHASARARERPPCRCRPSIHARATWRKASPASDASGPRPSVPAGTGRNPS